jgi:3-dehydroquinate synthase
MPEISVKLGKRAYPVVIGSGMEHRLVPRIRKLIGRNRLFVIYDAQVYALYGQRLGKLLKQVARPVNLVIPAGEKSKTPAQLGRIYDFLLSEKITRSDLILACGGGVVSDLVGYAAATVLRGVPWAVISTTLLGMVDASIGGKTAINHARGKNLVGAFWQPRLVWCDTQYLATLPSRELIGGMGELLKYTGLIGQSVLTKLRAFIDGGDLLDMSRLQPLIVSSVRYKANLVAADETDHSRRRVLNLGHTFGHAIEVGAGYGRLLHGEALVAGLKAACHMSGTTLARKRALQPYCCLIESFMPLIPRPRIDLHRAFEALFVDKKRTGERPKFILLEKLGQPIIVTNVKTDEVRKSLMFALSDFELTGELND